jgi:uncharacterized membrane protein YgcG
MKMQNSKTFLALTAVAGLCLLASNALAQSTSAPATASQVAPQLSSGVAEVVQLARASVGEGVIVKYVQNSGNAYGLDANQILYLKQQGISERIINAMLTQPKPAVAMQPMASSASTPETSTATVAPTVTYVQTAPPQTVYVVPNTQPVYYQPYYYPAYAWYPPVTFSFGWGGYYGGYRGGWHGGGGFHGGGGHR